MIDVHKELFGVCSKRYIFARSGKNQTIATGGCISFLLNDTFFAAIGHNEECTDFPYKNAGLYSQYQDSTDHPTHVGMVVQSTLSGVYGGFLEGDEPEIVAYMKVASLGELAIGPAELWMPTGTGAPTKYTGNLVAFFPDKPHQVFFEADDPAFPGAVPGTSGSVVTQNGKIAAVVAGADENPATLLYCTSAELMAEDLMRTVFEILADNS